MLRGEQLVVIEVAQTVSSVATAPVGGSESGDPVAEHTWTWQSTDSPLVNNPGPTALAAEVISLSLSDPVPNGVAGVPGPQAPKQPERSVQQRAANMLRGTSGLASVGVALGSIAAVGFLESRGGRKLGRRPGDRQPRTIAGLFGALPPSSSERGDRKRRTRGERDRLHDLAVSYIASHADSTLEEVWLGLAESLPEDLGQSPFESFLDDPRILIERSEVPGQSIRYSIDEEAMGLVGIFQDPDLINEVTKILQRQTGYLSATKLYSLIAQRITGEARIPNQRDAKLFAIALSTADAPNIYMSQNSSKSGTRFRYRTKKW